jgi:hypothetical protein
MNHIRSCCSLFRRALKHRRFVSLAGAGQDYAPVNLLLFTTGCGLTLAGGDAAGSSDGEDLVTTGGGVEF